MLAKICLGASGGALFLDQLQFGRRVAHETIDGNQNRQPELREVLDMPQQIGQAAFDRAEILLAERLLVGATMQLERPYRGHDHGQAGRQSCLTALDIEELLGSEVGAEAGFGHDIVGQRQRRPRGDHRVAAVRDVGERPAVNQHRIVLERLHQVGLGRILQHRGHGRRRLEIACRHRLAVAGFGHDDPRQPILEVRKVTRQAEDRHHFRCRGDVEARLAGKAVGHATKVGHQVAQRPVVHVEYTRPEHAPGIDAQRIAPVDVVVEHCGQQIVGRGDGVEVAGEMQVDVGHRHDLRLAATGGAALLAKARSETGLAERDRRLLAEAVEGIAQADRGRGLALASLGRADRRHQDELARLAALQGLDERGIELRLVPAIGLQRIARYAQPRRDIDHRLLDCAPRDLNI